MELNNEFTVSVPIDKAWEVLTDVEKIAPCLPGASLDGMEGDSYLGQVKIKVGPITAAYKGKAHFIEKDETTHKAVLRAEGRDTKGQGNASATITAKLDEAEFGTKVTVTTDLAISGRVAQFGRGVLADVSAKLLEQFVTSLETTVLGSDDTEANADATDVASGDQSSATENSTGSSTTEPKRVQPTPRREPEPVDLVGIAGMSVFKKFAPAAGGILLLLVILLRRRGRRNKH